MSSTYHMYLSDCDLYMYIHTDIIGGIRFKIIKAMARLISFHVLVCMYIT